MVLGVLCVCVWMWSKKKKRRVTEGTLSEILGATTLDQDKFLRVQSLLPSARQAIENASPVLIEAGSGFLFFSNVFLLTNLNHTHRDMKNKKNLGSFLRGPK